MLALAEAWIGTPHRRRAALRGAGCDCVGLIRGVIADATGRVICPPAWRGDWAFSGGEPILDAALSSLISPDPRPAPSAGDILAIRIGSGRVVHVGIADGRGGLIHATEGAGVVRASSLPPSWAVSSVWQIPAAAGCEAGATDIRPGDMIAIVHNGADRPADCIFIEYCDGLDMTPLGRSRFYTTTAEALADIPETIVDVETVR